MAGGLGSVSPAHRRRHYRRALADAEGQPLSAGLDAAERRLGGEEPHVEFSARIVKLFTARGVMTETFSDYHKFQVDSNIVEFKEKR
jgi:hypothetical protein